MSVISIYGAGQLGSNVAALLRERDGYEIHGPYGRKDSATALESGADLVIIATTSQFRDVSDDIQRAVKAGSNVLVSAEECANPWLVDSLLADRINGLAEDHDVTVLGTGLNPGLIFDALVLTLLGATPAGVQIEVTRIVDIGHFGPAVLKRLGIGFDESTFRHRVDTGEILGHAGFPQSMSIVAHGLHLAIDGITEEIDPIISDSTVVLPNGEALPAGTSVGIIQTYRALVDDHPWFTAVFRGHVRPDLIGWTPQDTIEFMRNGRCERSITIDPGLPSQTGSQAMVSNSVERVLNARSGWLTVADLPPAFGHHS